MNEYMGRKVNLFLIIMIMLVILGMGGLSIYYQRTFKGVNDQYEQISNSYKTCQQDLGQTKTALQNTITNLNSTETDIRKYDSLYEQKNQELTSTQKSLADTQANLQKETVFKQQFQKQSEAYYNQILILATNVTKLTNKVNDLEDTIDDRDVTIICLRSKAGSAGNVCS